MTYELTLDVNGGDSGEETKKISVKKELNDEEDLFCWPTLMKDFLSILKAYGFRFSEDTEYVFENINGMNSKAAADALEKAETQEY